MNKIDIKTRTGLILEGCLGKGFRLAGIAHAQSAQYDSSCEVPDFLLPDVTKPKWMIEVHQTEARNSLMMKTLRAFTAVCECKAHFGHRVIAVNLTFGNTKKSFASSPMAALGAIFDTTILPREVVRDTAIVVRLEGRVTTLAKDADLTVTQAVARIVEEMSDDLAALCKSINNQLERASTPKLMRTLWVMEEKRAKILPAHPTAGDATYYKRGVLKTLFLSDSQFTEWSTLGVLSACRKDVRDQAVLCGIAEVVEEIDGDVYILSKEVATLWNTGQAVQMRQLATAEIVANHEMEHFFADIRDVKRRVALAKAYTNFLNKNPKERRNEMVGSITNDQWGGVPHSRNCLFDLISISTGLAFNDFNTAIFEDKRYPITLWNPFSNLVQRSGPMGKLTPASKAACQIINEIIMQQEQLGNFAPREWDASRLAGALLKFRVENAIKLRRLDPLRAKVRDVCSSLGLHLKRVSVENILCDIAAESGVGRFLIYEIFTPLMPIRLLCAPVAVHDGHGDDKSKEWGARRLATLYRMTDEKITQSEYQQGLFVIDGEWADKDVARLHRSGWNRVVRLGELEAALREVFSMPNARESATIKRNAPPVTLLPAVTDDEDV